MGGRSAKRRRQQQRARQRAEQAQPLVAEAVLREWAAREVPSLLEPNPWTPAMHRIVAGLYHQHQQGHPWRCEGLEGRCGRPVRRFGDYCPECRPDYEDVGPVDWDFLGV